MARERDGCAVPTEELASVVAAWADRTGDADGAISSLHQRTCSSGTPVPARTIRNVLDRSFRTTELWIADSLVAAIGHPEVFHSGELTVMPNPSAARAARESCCGGSLNGSGAPD